MIKYQGFTLSELMIIITVLAILSAVAVPSFAALNKKRTFKQGTRCFGGKCAFYGTVLRPTQNIQTNLYFVA